MNLLANTIICLTPSLAWIVKVAKCTFCLRPPCCAVCLKHFKQVAAQASICTVCMIFPSSAIVTTDWSVVQKIIKDIHKYAALEQAQAPLYVIYVIFVTVYYCPAEYCYRGHYSLSTRAWPKLYCGFTVLCRRYIIYFSLHKNLKTVVSLFVFSNMLRSTSICISSPGSPLPAFVVYRDPTQSYPSLSSNFS